MKTIAKSVIGIALLGTIGTNMAAANEIHFGGIYSTDQLRGVRFGYRTDSIKLPFLESFGNPDIALEPAINHWQNSNNHADNITALSISPIARWRLTDNKRPLYLEAGIGVAYMDDNQIGDRRLSTHAHFEDRIGMSWQYDTESDARISVQYTHYSNADIDTPNDGLDFYSIYWVYPL